VPCAIPPKFLEERHERHYSLSVSATYDVDKNGKLTGESITAPHLQH
jgi:hypothetical protein